MHGAKLMARTVYLHVGMGRCGSTAIQQFATGNSAKLLERDLNYPSSREIGIALSRGGRKVGPNHPANAHALARDLSVKRFSSLARCLAHLQGSRILLSSELLYGRPLNDFKAMDEALRSHDLDLNLIIYLREQREWLVSRYAQAVKSKRWTISLEDYLRRGYSHELLDYAARFRALSTVLKPEQIIIRIYERDKLFGRDVCTDLFSVMGVNAADLISDDTNTNASASVLEVETMRVVNTFVQRDFDHRAFLQRARRMAESEGWDLTKDLYRLVPPALMRELGEYFAKKNAELMAELPAVGRTPFESSIPRNYEMLDASERLNERTIGMLLNYFGLSSESTTQNVGPPPPVKTTELPETMDI
jgi:hypothetical protein